MALVRYLVSSKDMPSEKTAETKNAISTSVKELLAMFLTIS